MVESHARQFDLCTDAGGISGVGHVNGVWAAAPPARVMRMSEERIVQEREYLSGSIGAFLRLARPRRPVEIEPGLT